MPKSAAALRAGTYYDDLIILVKESVALYNGNRDSAAQRVLIYLDNHQVAKRAVVPYLMEIAVKQLIRLETFRLHRKTVDRRRVVTPAYETSPTIPASSLEIIPAPPQGLLAYPLAVQDKSSDSPGGKFLTFASVDEILAEAEHHAMLTSRNGIKARWLSAIAALLPEGLTVGQYFSAQDLANLYDQATGEIHSALPTFTQTTHTKPQHPTH